MKKLTSQKSTDPCNECLVDRVRNASKFLEVLEVSQSFFFLI